MPRPTFLMAEVEPPDGISARKLLLETGKFNVITAYSEREALETLQTFPNSDAVIVHSSLCEKSCDEVIDRIKKLKPKVKVIMLSPEPRGIFKTADYEVSSHEPQELLILLRDIFGDPRNSPEGKLR